MKYCFKVKSVDIHVYESEISEAFTEPEDIEEELMDKITSGDADLISSDNEEFYINYMEALTLRRAVRERSSMEEL